MLDYHHTWLNLFDEFQATQDRLDSSNLLKLSPVKPCYTVYAYKGSKQVWEDWAYDNDGLVSLKKIAAKSGYTVTVEKLSND